MSNKRGRRQVPVSITSDTVRGNQMWVLKLQCGSTKRITKRRVGGEYLYPPFHVRCRCPVCKSYINRRSP